MPMTFSATSYRDRTPYLTVVFACDSQELKTASFLDVPSSVAEIRNAVISADGLPVSEDCELRQYQCVIPYISFERFLDTRGLHAHTARNGKCACVKDKASVAAAARRETPRSGRKVHLHGRRQDDRSARVHNPGVERRVGGAPRARHAGCSAPPERARFQGGACKPA